MNIFANENNILFWLFHCVNKVIKLGLQNIDISEIFQIYIPAKFIPQEMQFKIEKNKKFKKGNVSLVYGWKVIYDYYIIISILTYFDFQKIHSYRREANTNNGT